ncbi:MAG: nucleotidyltransferase domain-containing protein [Acidimicrobiia bacterium]|nr:nucleotidyltransferase domain-containing protein [Acidimicrobiia bacterium]MYJ13877.1 nucleotidyltransferase domain-containing protein [Acidimicrobiia bacterium]
MAVFAPPGVPTREDAEAAAEALVAVGVDEVLLFGSVARGTASSFSDIDLVAIFADLDYAERQRCRHELEATAEAAVAWPVQVHVTDLPEWRARVGGVSASFEHRIAGEAVPVATAADRRPVDWGKEMVLPMSDPLEALSYFDARVIPRLRDVAAAATRDHAESDPHLSLARQERARLQRLTTLCTAAALTAETSLKALAVLGGETAPTEADMKRAGHSIARGLALLADTARAEAAAVFDRHGVDLDVLSTWRERSTYPDDAEVLHADAERLAPAYAAMAAEITALLAAHLRRRVDPGPALEEALAQRDSHAWLIGAVDVRAGMPTPPEGIYS